MADYTAGISESMVHTPLSHHSLPHSQARLLSFFGKPGSDLITLGSHKFNSFTCSAHWRFLYFHGQKHARLIRDQSVYDKPKHERSLLFTILSLLLFMAPGVHLRDLEKLWTDEVIIESVWRNHVMMLLGEWGDMILWVRIQCRNMTDPSSPVSRDFYVVDSAAICQHGVSCYPWRGPFKS